MQALGLACTLKGASIIVIGRISSFKRPFWRTHKHGLVWRHDVEAVWGDSLHGQDSSAVQRLALRHFFEGIFMLYILSC